jgi:hypothetical protein
LHNPCKTEERCLAVTDHREPQQHPDSRVDVTRNYVTACVRTLLQQGLIVDRSWLDPSDPRDATVVLGDSRALVWDEVTGWRVGLFRAGEPGVRTTLEGPAHLGGGPLLTPAELAWRVTSGATATRREYRSYADSDGVDEALRAY